MQWLFVELCKQCCLCDVVCRLLSTCNITVHMVSALLLLTLSRWLLSCHMLPVLQLCVFNWLLYI